MGIYGANGSRVYGPVGIMRQTGYVGQMGIYGANGSRAYGPVGIMRQTGYVGQMGGYGANGDMWGKWGYIGTCNAKRVLGQMGIYVLFEST